MALADALCASCGAPAPKGRAAQAMLEKADALHSQGSLPEAARMLERALQSWPEPGSALNWRKLGVWREKMGQAAQAGAAFKAALDLDDGDEMAHQLFISNLGRQGRGLEALAHYKARLEKNPGDEMAARQVNIIRLSADFLSQAPPTLALHEPTRVERWLKPTPLKVSLLLANAGLCLAIMVKIMLTLPAQSALGAAEGAPAVLEPATFLADTFNDPWVWAFQAALSFTALAIMYWSRK